MSTLIPFSPRIDQNKTSGNCTIESNAPTRRTNVANVPRTFAITGCPTREPSAFQRPFRPPLAPKFLHSMCRQLHDRFYRTPFVLLPEPPSSQLMITNLSPFQTGTTSILLPFSYTCRPSTTPSSVPSG